MAKESGSSETPVELWRKFASTRESVAREMGGLRYELDFPLKFKKAFQRNTSVFIGGALAVGLLAALLRARTQKVYVGPGAKKNKSREKTLLESGALPRSDVACPSCGRYFQLSRDKLSLSRLTHLRAFLALDAVRFSRREIQRLRSRALAILCDALNELDFPHIYASGKNGWATLDMAKPNDTLAPLFDLIVRHVPEPKNRPMYV